MGASLDDRDVCCSHCSINIFFVLISHRGRYFAFYLLDSVYSLLDSNSNFPYFAMKPRKVQGGHPRFYEIIEEMKDLHDRKNNNYATDQDPLSNLRECQRMGLPPVTGVFVRIGDKYCRLMELAKGKKDLVGESVIDTLMDMAVYCVLAIILIEENIKKKK